MDHEEAKLVLADLVSGRLGPEEAGRVRDHVASCAECRETAATLSAVGEEVRAHGQALFEPHPTSDEIVRYAMGKDELAAGDLARIGAHLRACPTCSHEVKVTREAASSATAWWRRLAGWFVSPAMAPAPALRIAAVALLVIMVYPAYLGLVKLPQVREGAGPRPGAVAVAPETPAADVRPGWSGGFQLLHLVNLNLRDHYEIATIAIAPGQPYQPIVISEALSSEEVPISQRSVRIAIRRLPDLTLTWEYAGPVADIWDPNLEALCVSVEGGDLPPGEYEILLREGTQEASKSVGRFRVAAAEVQ